MTVRELIGRTEHFPVNTWVAFEGYAVGHDDRSPTPNSTVGFGTDPCVHLRNGNHGDHNERLLVVADDLASVDDLLLRRIANS